MTYYEIWQQEKYGNILPNSNQQPNEYENETERYIKSSNDSFRDDTDRQSDKTSE